MQVFRSLLVALAAGAASNLAASNLAASAPAAPVPAVVGPSGIVALAAANVGKHACSVNSLGTRAFGSSCTGNDGKPEFWCADFAKWVWQHAGVAGSAGLSSDAGSFYTYGEDNATLSAVPAVGDAAVFDYSGDGLAAHVAIVTQVDANGSIETVSGDWGGDPGSEARFSSTSSVVPNDPAYLGSIGTEPAEMGMVISAFVAPVGIAVTPVEGGTWLTNGQTLSSGQALASPNGLYLLEMQSDGNLVEYTNGRALWSSGTSGRPGSRAVVRSDGNLVVYSPAGEALWSTRTAGAPGGVTMAIDENGSLVLDGRGRTLWSHAATAAGVLAAGQTLRAGQSLDSPNGFWAVTMQSDGNLVASTAGRTLWSTRTSGHPGGWCTLLRNGDLVIYSTQAKVLWSSATAGATAAYTLSLASSGTLVLNGPNGPLWSHSA